MIYWLIIKVYNCVQSIGICPYLTGIKCRYFSSKSNPNRLPISHNFSLTLDGDRQRFHFAPQ